jgi:hypothetical protein
MYKYDRNEVQKNGTKVKKGEEDFGTESLLRAGDEFVEMMYSNNKRDVEKFQGMFNTLKSE